MRTFSRNKSYANINQFRFINESDIRMDNHGVLAREIPALIREANDIPPRRKPKPLRYVLAQYRANS